MSLYNILLHITIFLIKCNVSKIISHNFTLDRGAPKLSYHFGTPPQTHTIRLSFKFPCSWLSPYFYNLSASETSVLIKEKVEVSSFTSLTLRGPEVEDIMIIDNETTIRNFTFDVLRSTIVYQFGVISFGHSFLNESQEFSILHTMKEQNLINKTNFAIKLDMDNQEGTLYYGGFPKTDNLVVQSCDVDKSTPGRYHEYWSCFLDKVAIVDDTAEKKITKPYFYNKKYSHFSSSDNFFVPDEFLEYLIKNLFKEEIKKGLCELTRLKEIMCNTSVKDRTKDLVFFFNDVGYIVKNKYLWTVKGEKAIYKICGGYKVFSGVKNEWEIGNLFLSGVAAEFSYEDDKVYFYSEDSVIVIDNRMKKCLLLCQILSFILAAGTILVAVIYGKEKINKKINNKLLFNLIY